MAFGVEFTLDKSVSCLSKFSLLMSTIGIEGLILSHTATVLLSFEEEEVDMVFQKII